MAEYYSDSRPELIHCQFCGEDYADTYKACPFCDTAPSGRKVRSRSSAPAKGARSGRRVRTNTRGGGYGGAKSPLAIIGIILAVALVIAAAVIIIMLVKSTLSENGDNNQGNGVTSSQVDEGGSSSGTSSEDDGSVGVVAPDGLTLDQTAATIHQGGTLQLTATADPVNWIGQIIWSTSDPTVATVDQSGEVTYVGDGDCVITASANGVTATCNITCGGDNQAAATLTVYSYGIAVTEVSIDVGEVVNFRVEGGSTDNYVWSVEDSGVAIVDPATGKLTGVMSGKTTLIVKCGNEYAEVLIRVRS